MTRPALHSFSAAVYWRPFVRRADDLVADFTLIRDAGFSCVRAHEPSQVLMPGQDFGADWADPWVEAAERVGLGLILHGVNVPPPGVLGGSGIGPEELERIPADDPRLEGLLAAWIDPFIERHRGSDRVLAWAGVGEPPAGRAGLADDTDRAQFRDWLEESHGTAEAVDAAWNLYPDAALVRSLDDAVRIAAVCGRGPSPDGAISGVDRAKLNYGAARDVMRFMTDRRLGFSQIVHDRIGRLDPTRPRMLGTHQLLGNNAQLLWDNPKRARIADVHATSIHLSWHFELVDGEVDRPTLVQAKMTADYAPGKLSSAHETTGGPVQFSGGHGNSMSPGLMRRLCACYVGAGNRGIGFWTWNARPGGWEAGEYAMTTLTGEPTAWGRAAGAFSRVLAERGAELAAAEARPRVALLEDWDTQAIYCLEPDRQEGFRDPRKLVRGTPQDPRRSLVGWARALLDANVPFRFVVPGDDLSGYDAVVVTNARALADGVLAQLTEYATAGGRVVADAQAGFLDPWGKVRPTGPGGALDRLFGGWVDQLHDTGRGALALSAGDADLPVTGFFADLRTGDAGVSHRFADGRTAALDCSRGAGSACLIGFEPGRLTLHPGDAALQAWMIDRLRLGGPAWSSTAPATSWLHGPDADHVLLPNDGPAREVRLTRTAGGLTAAEDLLGTAPDLRLRDGGTVTLTLPAGDAVWLRLPHA